MASDGSVAVAGVTSSPDFAAAVRAPPQLAEQAFVARTAADGSRVLSSRRLGGWNGRVLGGIALDSSANAWVAGASWAADFPVTSDALRSTMSGYTDGFLAKVSPDGALL